MPSSNPHTKCKSWHVTVIRTTVTQTCAHGMPNCFVDLSPTLRLSFYFRTWSAPLPPNCTIVERKGALLKTASHIFSNELEAWVGLYWAGQVQFPRIHAMHFLEIQPAGNCIPMSAALQKSLCHRIIGGTPASPQSSSQCSSWLSPAWCPTPQLTCMPAPSSSLQITCLLEKSPYCQSLPNWLAEQAISLLHFVPQILLCRNAFISSNYNKPMKQIVYSSYNRSWTPDNTDLVVHCGRSMRPAML